VLYYPEGQLYRLTSNDLQNVESFCVDRYISILNPAPRAGLASILVIILPSDCLEKMVYIDQHSLPAPTFK